MPSQLTWSALLSWKVLPRVVILAPLNAGFGLHQEKGRVVLGNAMVLGHYSLFPHLMFLRTTNCGCKEKRKCIFVVISLFYYLCLCVSLFETFMLNVLSFHFLELVQ